MKKFNLTSLSFLLFILSGFVLFSCSDDDSSLPDSWQGISGYMPDLYLIYNDKYGYIDKIGNIAINYKFEEASDFVFDLARFYEDGKYGLIDKSGNIVLAATYNNLGLMSDCGLVAAINDDGEYGYIDKNGKLQIRYQFDYAGWFHNGYAVIRDEWDYGFIDETGKIVITPSYGSVGNFNEGYAVVYSDGYGVINEKGTIKVPTIYDNMNSYVKDGLIGVGQDGDWGYINTSGKIVIDLLYDYAAPFFENKGRVELNGNYGFINKNGDYVINPMYDDANDFSEGLAAVKSNSYWGYIDSGNNFIISPQYSYADDFINGVAYVEFKSGKWGYIDKSGKVLWSSTFSKKSAKNQMSENERQNNRLVLGY